MKRQTRIAIHPIFTLVSLLLAALSASMNAQNVSVQFMPFADSIQNVSSANSADYVGLAGNQVSDTASFEQMRQHILTMYSGVTASHSFVQEVRHFDCISISQRPSARLLGISRIALAGLEGEAAEVRRRLFLAGRRTPSPVRGSLAVKLPLRKFVTAPRTRPKGGHDEGPRKKYRIN